jgi:uncharacterized protein YdhG (YjbR/CyaY superfamily)
MATKATKATSIDAYLAPLPAAQRAALERFRAQVHDAVPEVTETIAYDIPGFRLDGRYLLGCGVAGKRCSLYVGRRAIVAHERELAPYRLGRGTVSYDPEDPPPPELVASLIATRVAAVRDEGR